MRIGYYAENFEALLATCRERQTAVQTIKSVAMAPWLGRARTSSTWYEPLQRQEDIDLAVWWALGRSQIFVISAGDVNLLPRFLDAAARLEQAPSQAQMEQLAERSGQQPIFV
jgi:hypothetical protein